MKNLISMTDFVLELGETPTFDTDQGDWYCMELSKLDKIRNYAKFLKQPLALWMFVACDEDGNVLEVPTPIINDVGNIIYQERFKQFQQAKERCLFEGFEVIKQKDYYIITYDNGNVWTSWNGSKTIEDLVLYKPLLTATAQKEIGL